ncbi:MAG: hypothetical protein CMJ78_13670 [Planctomycetaceae bacterium]|nr:hypothetical protein [Planctomycetaceae bacterium]
MTQAATTGEQPRRPLRARTPGLVVLSAVTLTLIFWNKLWLGGGLIGGDSLTYFFPQKTYFADRLADDEVPLWNNLAGHGYPLVADSQTATWYPTTLLFYATLDVNTAFNANIILHYVMTFSFTWLFARRLGLSAIAATFAATVFTYGWFPPRMTVEWAIVTGSWLPLAFWCAESFLQTFRQRYVIGLTLTLAIQMLAGHFSLAFITQSFLIAYVGFRLAYRVEPSLKEGIAKKSIATAIIAAIAFSYPLAAAQLLPTWELKEQSNRRGLPIEDAEYGRVPPWYLSQLIAPWYTYTGQVDVNSDGGYETNIVAAHLYLGQAPVWLLIIGVFTGTLRKHRVLWIWFGLGLFGMLLATGVVVDITKHLPGFGYFKIPGRYGIITTLSGAFIAAATLQRLLDQSEGPRHSVICLLAFSFTILDLVMVSNLVRFTTILDDSYIQYRMESNVRNDLLKHPEPARVFAPGQNLVTCIGVSVSPNYLGLAPKAYTEPPTAIPEPISFGGKVTTAQVDWMEKYGVTHLLAESTVEGHDGRLRLITPIGDAFLNRGFARAKPFYLYEVVNSRGRLTWKDPTQNGATAAVESYKANRVEIRTKSISPGRLILTELAYPGWQVRVDGQIAEPLVEDEMFRAVDVPAGEHEVVWEYRPTSIAWGAGISLLSLTILMVAARLPRRFQSSHHSPSDEPSSENTETREDPVPTR